jgi:hypothetical protein
MCHTSVDWVVCGSVFCCQPIHARDLCRYHYDRARRLGVLAEWPWRRDLRVPTVPTPMPALLRPLAQLQSQQTRPRVDPGVQQAAQEGADEGRE